MYAVQWTKFWRFFEWSKSTFERAEKHSKKTFKKMSGFSATCCKIIINSISNIPLVKKRRGELQMAVELKRTKNVQVNGIKMLVFGQAGAGKTTLIKTLPNPVVISAEAGLLSLKDADLPYVEITTMEQLQEVYGWLTEGEGKDFESVALDSISEIAEVVLSHEKQNTKDPRQAYGEMQDQMQGLIRAFRDLPGRNVYMTAKIEKSTDEMGRVMYAPAMPGNKMAQMLPFFFDEVLALRVEKDAEGNMQRSLQCESDGLWQAKDRSGKLGQWFEPDLTKVIEKITGGEKSE